MPIHEYECGNCSHHWCEYYKMSSLVAERLICPKCNLNSGVKQFSASHTYRDFAKPIQHYSCAVMTRAEAEAIARACPDVEICMDEASEMFGVPISRNQTAKEQLMKFTGYIDKQAPK
jgi:putative FmdB family regulatory protein